MRRSSSSTADATHPSIHRPSPKRRRVALACGNCRERKVRCDGGRPVCKACQRRGSTEQQPCEYLVVADTAKYQSERAYLHTLREHIAHLESSAQQQTGNPEQTGKPNGTNESIREAPIPTVEQQTGDLPASSTLPHSISAMGTALPDTEDDKREQYYGQPSIVSLVQECAQASPGQDSTLPFTPSTTSSSTTSGTVAKSGISMSSLISDDFSLPPRKTTDWLLDVYFTNSHLFYPWVHKESLLASYETIWSSQDNESPNTNGLPDVGIGGQNCPAQVFYCALNAILAIACEFSNIRSREKRTSSLVFYERMKGLLNIDFLDSGSLAHVQALLLVALYLQCTPYPRQCWNVVGMAYRMSVGLGLHLSQYIPELTLLEKEMRWRAWCACVQMDIILSMTMGRPAMTPTPHKVPLPSPIDDKYLAMGDDTLQPAETISPNQFLCENMRLIGILGKILSTIYHSAEPGAKVEAPRTFQVDFQSVMDVDRALEDFESSLHPALRWSAPRAGCNDTGTNLLCRRQSNVLHARYLHLKLLLYRPAFSEHCSASTPDTTNQTQQQSPQKPASQSWSSLCRSNCATACVRSACELIESLATATLQDATGAWWYGVFCKSPFHPIPSWSEPVLYTMQSVNCSYIVVTDLITAGVILVAADSSGVAVPLDGDGVDKVMQESAWDQCLRTLHRMVDVHPSARDYALALGGLKQRHGNTASNMGNHRHDHSATPYRAQSSTNPVATPSPFLSNWDNGLEDIMLPAHWLQDVDEGLLLPNLF